MYQTFSNVISLKLSLLTVHKAVSFFKIFTDVFLLLLKVHLSQKNTLNIAHRSSFNITAKPNKIWKSETLFYCHSFYPLKRYFYQNWTLMFIKIQGSKVCRRNRQEEFCKKGVRKKFRKMYWKTPVPESLFPLSCRPQAPFNKHLFLIEPFLVASSGSGLEGFWKGF